VTPEVELAERVLAQIEEHPEQWQQGEWAFRADCGTVYCFAGWAVRLAHPEAEFLFGVSSLRDGSATLAQLGGSPPRDIKDLATELLGLRWRGADVLFDGRNTLEELREYVRQLSAGASFLTPSDRFLDDEEEEDDGDA
jgi:hypothetical protein